jgi:hypothetical protein
MYDRKDHNSVGFVLVGDPIELEAGEKVTLNARGDVFSARPGGPDVWALGDGVQRCIDFCEEIVT